jgi:hypothetical protein
MTILTTNNEILMYALDVADETQGANSDFYDPAIGFMNSVYRQIAAGGTALNPDIDEKWNWLRSSSPGVITLQPAFTGTAALTFNSTAVTLSAIHATSLAGWVFWVPGGNGDYYRVAAHTAGTAAITLDSPYTDNTNAAASVKAFKLVYDLPAGVEQVLGAMRTSRGEDKIQGIDPDRLLDDYPFHTFHAGVPDVYAMTSLTKVMFNSYAGDDTSDLIRIEFDYNVTISDLGDDSNEPLIPLAFRASVLGEFTAFYILQDKHDNKADAIGKLAQAGLLAMAGENRRRLQTQGSDSFGQIYPRRPPGKGRRGLLRTTSGSIIG